MVHSFSPCKVVYFAVVMMEMGSIILSPVSAGPIDEKYPKKEITVGKAASGFDSGTATGMYNAMNTFKVNDKNFVIDAVPVHPVQADEVKSVVDFMTILNNKFKTWTFNYLDADKKDLTLPDKSLVVGTYDVKTPIQNVLEDFYLNYDITKATGANDPKDKTKLHWIQVFKSNWALNDGKPHLYELFQGVDNLGADTPYYDTKAAANFSPDPKVGNPDAALGLPFLDDDPKRIDADLSAYDPTKPNNGLLYDYFETFLVQESADNPKSVNIYDGVQWGWTVQTVPEPAMLLLLSLGLVSLGLVSAVARRRHP